MIAIAGATRAICPHLFSCRARIIQGCRGRTRGMGGAFGVFPGWGEVANSEPIFRFVAYNFCTDFRTVSQISSSILALTRRLRVLCTSTLLLYLPYRILECWSAGTFGYLCCTLVRVELRVRPCAILFMYDCTILYEYI